MRAFYANPKAKSTEEQGRQRAEFVKIAKKKLEIHCRKQGVPKDCLRHLNALFDQLPAEMLNDNMIFPKMGISEQQRPEEAFKRIIQFFDAEQTFELIVMMTPTKAKKICQYMTRDQLQLFLLIDSASSEQFLRQISTWFAAMQEKTLVNLLETFDKYFSSASSWSAKQKADFLLRFSDPTKN